MRKLLAIGCICLLCLACQQEILPTTDNYGSAYPAILHKVDSLTEVKPDSALWLIDSLNAEMAKAEEPIQMYYKLLTVKAQEAAGKRHTYIAFMRSVLGYYEQTADAHLLPDAYYLMACTYRDQGSEQLALEHFQKTLDSTTDLKRQRTIYLQMGHLLDKQGLYDDALLTYRQALNIDSQLKENVAIVYDLRYLGITHRHLHATDSALVYFRQAEQLANAQGSQPLRNLIRTEMADIQLEQRNYNAASRIVTPLLSHLTDDIRYRAYAIAAEVYYAQKRYPLAARYLIDVAENGDTDEQKARAHQLLAHIAEQRGDSKMAMVHINNYEGCLNRIQRLKSVEAVAQINALYNYQQALKEKEQLAEQSERQSRLIAILTVVVATLVLLSFGIFGYMTRKRRKMRTKLQELEADQQEQKRQAERSIADKEKQINNLEALLQQSGDENSALRQHLEEMQQTLNEQVTKERKQILLRENADEQLKNTDIYRRIIYLINKKRLLPQKDYEELRRTFEALNPDFMQRLLGLCELSDLEVEISLLRRMGVSPADIASLTDYTKAHISGVRRTLYARVKGSKGSPSDWDDLIASL